MLKNKNVLFHIFFTKLKSIEYEFVIIFLSIRFGLFEDSKVNEYVEFEES